MYIRGQYKEQVSCDTFLVKITNEVNNISCLWSMNKWTKKNI